MTTEPADATPDLVGRTSARLLATGVARRERLDALYLLAILDASTDAGGRVRRPIDDLAGEFELVTVDVIRSLDHLERAGAVRREGSLVRILDGDAEVVGGMHLAGFIDDVRSALDHEAMPQGTSRRSPWLARAGAVLVAAAAIAFVAQSPTKPAVDRPVAVAAKTTTPLASSTYSVPLLAIPATVADHARRTDTATTSVIPQSTDAATLAAAGCPIGTPITRVIGTVVRIANPSSAEIVVTKLTLAGAASTVRLVVPAGQTVEGALPVATPSVSVDAWEWSDPATARACGS